MLSHEGRGNDGAEANNKKPATQAGFSLAM
jgi:hypothetical protein